METTCAMHSYARLKISTQLTVHLLDAQCLIFGWSTRRRDLNIAVDSWHEQNAVST